MHKQLNGIVRLTRYQEYSFFVAITTLIGAAAANGSVGLRLAIVLLANWLAVGFAFMINDLQDASDDAANPTKAGRNPVSAGTLSVRVALAASLAVAAAAAFLFALLGTWPFVLGLACLLIGFLYSWRPIRLKARPFVDLPSHALMLAGLQFLSAYFTFQSRLAGSWLVPFTLLVAISLYGELYNEMRDLEEDRKVGITHTASLLGAQTTHWLMLSFLALGIVMALVMVLVIKLVAAWVVILALVVLAILLVRPILQVRRNRWVLEVHEPFQKPVEIATALALLAQFVGLFPCSVLHVGLLVCR